jgi:hypothetical protein
MDSQAPSHSISIYHIVALQHVVFIVMTSCW